MKLTAILTLAPLVFTTQLLASDVGILHLSPPLNMERADFYYTTPIGDPRAVLILSPGVNGSGEGFVRDPAWLQFARSNNLGLVGLSFASPSPDGLAFQAASQATPLSPAFGVASASPDALALRAASQATTRPPPLVVASSSDPLHDGTGYYYASKGSGEKLLEGIRKIYGKELPLLLYGFSGGAHFTSRFEEWNPSRVLSWCAYSAGWWDLPHHNAANPPGIIACGDQDPRYGATLSYFKQGRAIGKPWLWVSLPKTAHQGSAALDQFVREYFSARLADYSSSSSAPDLSSSRLSESLWADVDTKKTLSTQEAATQPTESAWLPSRQLFDDWRKIHEP